MQIDKKTEALLRGIFGKDEEGRHYVRIIPTSPEEVELSNAITPTSNPSLSTLLSQAIVLDVNGNPALRMAAVEFGSTRHDALQARQAANAENAKKKKLEEEQAAAEAKKAKAAEAEAEAKAAKKKAEAEAKAAAAQLEAQKAAKAADTSGEEEDL